MRLTLLKSDNKSTGKDRRMCANTLLDVARVMILGTICEHPDSDAERIIRITGIGPARVYREINVLLNAGIIRHTWVSTSGHMKRLYCTNYKEISFVISSSLSSKKRSAVALDVSLK